MGGRSGPDRGEGGGGGGCSCLAAEESMSKIILCMLCTKTEQTTIAIRHASVACCLYSECNLRDMQTQRHACQRSLSNLALRPQRP